MMDKFFGSLLSRFSSRPAVILIAMVYVMFKYPGIVDPWLLIAGYAIFCVTYIFKAPSNSMPNGQVLPVMVEDHSFLNQDDFPERKDLIEISLDGEPIVINGKINPKHIGRIKE